MMNQLERMAEAAAQAREKVAAEAEAERAREKARAVAAEHAALARLERLAGNEDVRWFLDEYLRPMVAAERDAALDVKTLRSEVRAIHAERHAMGVEILGRLDAEVEAHRARLAAAAAK